jgi:heme/copper-type cytochrome/quinol oxidase subunit 2
MKLIMNLLLGIMAIIVLVAVMPTVDEMIVDNRDGDNWNCASDPDYNATNEEHKLTCTVSFLISPFIMLGVIIAVMMSVMYGSREPETQYTQGY